MVPDARDIYNPADVAELLHLAVAAYARGHRRQGIRVLHMAHRGGADEELCRELFELVKGPGAQWQAWSS